jgi:hypothetical protein
MVRGIAERKKVLYGNHFGFGDAGGGKFAGLHLL